MVKTHFTKYLMAAVSGLVISTASISHASPFSTNTNWNTNVNTNVNANLNVLNQNQNVDIVNKNNLNQWQRQNQYQSQANIMRGNGDRNDVRVTTAPNLAGLVASPHTCMGSVTLSGGGGGLVSLGVGSTYRDRECDLREAIKLAAQLGLTDEALRLFYQLEAVRNGNGNGVTTDQSSRGDTHVGMESGTNTPSTTLVEWWFRKSR